MRVTWNLTSVAPFPTRARSSCGGHRGKRWALLLGLVSFGCNADPTQRVNATAPANTGFIARSITVDGHEHKYAVFLPYAYTAEQSWPTIVFLHGLGEAGSDGRKCLTVGLAPVIGQNPSTFPFIAIFPQSTGDWTGQDRERLALACLDDCQREYTIDAE